MRANSGLGLAAISTVLLISRLTDFVTDPLTGWISDRTRTRFGRRKPYLVIGLPVMMLGIWKLFMPEPPGDIWYMLIWNTVVYLGWTIVVLPYHAWGAELSESYMVRASITAIRQVYVIAGLIGASVVIWFYQVWLGRSDSGEVLTGIGWTLLVILPISVALLLLMVPEREVAAPPRQRAWWRELSSMLKIGPFRRMIYVALAILADVVDVDTAVTRQKRASLYFAVFGAIDKIGIAVGLFIALQVLNLTGYDPQIDPNAAGLWMIRLEYAVIPTFFFLLASFLVWNYPLTNERHSRLLAALERREAGDPTLHRDFEHPDYP